MRDDGKRRLPEGVSDALPAECARRRDIEGRILERFSLCGYDEVRTPALEYFSLFQGPGGPRESAVIKTLDHTGRILALRPEFTTPIARLVSTRMRDSVLPLRLCYLGVAFDNQHDHAGMRRTEFTQAGVEMLGLGGAFADAEVIALAASIMETVGLTDYLIDIGQVDFFKGLMEEAGLGSDLAEELRMAVEQKDSLSMEMLLRSVDVSGDVSGKIMALPSLYGGPEVIRRAMDMTRSPRCRVALNNLAAVYDILVGYGLAEHITLDLGMVHSINYYTGAIFRGISGQLGAPILSGGRYDALMKEFGMDVPATGFALGVERLIEAVARQDGPVGEVGVDVVVVCETYDAKNLAAIEEIRRQGLRVEMAYEQDEGAVLEYARRRGARAMKLRGGEEVER